MSSIDIIQSITSEYGGTTEETTATDDLGKDAFLNLLITQMQYQDPLEPTTNEAFLAQMAQFSALEQMQNLNTSSMFQQAYSLIGKQVVGTSESDSEYITGVVEAVTIKVGEAYLLIGEEEIALSNVEAVVNDGDASNDELVEAINLINETLETINEKIDTLATETEEEEEES